MNKKAVLNSLPFLFLFFIIQFFSGCSKIKVVNYVCVSDGLFADYFSLHETEKSETAELNFISTSDFTKLKSENPLTINKVAAVITEEKNISLEENKSDLNKEYFVLDSTPYVPSSPVNFETPGDKLNSLLEPEFSVAVTKPEELPKNSRAFPVNGRYCDDENYSLTVKNCAAVTYLDSSLKNEIQAECKKVFHNELTQEKSSENKIAFVANVGDIMVARGVEDILINDDDGAEKIFGSTLKVLQNNHLTMGNLEGVVTDSTKNAIKTYTFKFKKEVLPVLKKCGFNYFMITNNHCYDFGEDGFKDTLNALKEFDIPTSGAGFNKDEAEKFYYTQINGQTFAVISCGAYPVERSGFNGEKTAVAGENKAGILWKSDSLLEKVKAESEKGNVVLVNVHGGQEYVFSPDKNQQAFYKSLIDSGASIVYGSHPHVLQPAQWYNGGLIIYSMGNFLFNGMEEMHGAQESEIVRIGFFRNKPLYFEIYPAKLNGKYVSLKQVFS